MPFTEKLVSFDGEESNEFFEFNWILEPSEGNSVVKLFLILDEEKYEVA